MSAPADLSALDLIAKRLLQQSPLRSDIEVLLLALPNLLQLVERDAEWRRVYALVWSVIHGEGVDAPLPPIGPRGLVSAAAEFSAMRAMLSEARAARAEAESHLSIVRRDFDERGRIIASLEAQAPPEPAP